VNDILKPFGEEETDLYFQQVRAPAHNSENSVVQIVFSEEQSWLRHV
jgi:hypothetical protein